MLQAAGRMHRKGQCMIRIEDDILHFQQLFHNIGNLTLIRYNNKFGQKTFDEKKETYINKSGLQIAKTQITDKNRWHPSGGYHLIHECIRQNKIEEDENGFFVPLLYDEAKISRDPGGKALCRARPVIYSLYKIHEETKEVL